MVGFWWSSSTLDQRMRRSLLFVVDSQQHDVDIWHTPSHDLIYTGLHVKAVLAHKKVKANGKTSSQV
jgi:hypothetical protein